MLFKVIKNINVLFFIITFNVLANSNRSDIEKEIIKTGLIKNIKIHKLTIEDVLNNINQYIDKKNGITLLMYAANNGNTNLVKLLLDYNANVSIKTREKSIHVPSNWMALDFAKNKKYQNIINLIKSKKIRIGFWSSWQVKCGIAMYTEHIVNELNNNGYKAFAYKNDISIKNLLTQIKFDKIDILNIQYEISLFFGNSSPFKSMSDFVSLIKDIKNMGIKVVITVHSERENLKELLEEVDACIYTRPSNIFKLDKINLIPIGAPIFKPIQNKNELRAKYGFAHDDTILTTTGFMLPSKQNSEVLNQLATEIKKNPKLKIQLLTSINDANDFIKNLSLNEYEKIKNVITDNQIENQIIHKVDFLQQQEVNERLFISDLGFLWGDAEGNASSASIKEFISSRLPLIVTDCPRFSSDAIRGVIKTEINMPIFVKTILNVINDKEKLNRLIMELEAQYNEINNGKMIKRHINLFESLIKV